MGRYPPPLVHEIKEWWEWLVSTRRGRSRQAENGQKQSFRDCVLGRLIYVNRSVAVFASPRLPVSIMTTRGSS